ncbi:MAG: lysine transporter LysE [Odoribacter sp.]|nr:lysine transporter LysE [Odoribacter sp.]
MFPAIIILFKGIILGLMVSMPLGPVGIILVNRTIKRGILSGFFSGMGLATADTILAIIAGLGFTLIVSFFHDEKFIISLISGLIIIGVGIKVLINNPVNDFRRKEKGKKSLSRDYFSTLILAISNPFTIFIFVAFFSGINVNSDLKPQLVLFLLVPGVFIGTLSWWFCLCWFVSRFKKNIRLRSIVKVNQIAGIAIVIIGLVVLISLFTTLFS